MAMPAYARSQNVPQRIRDEPDAVKSSRSYGTTEASDYLDWDFPERTDDRVEAFGRLGHDGEANGSRSARPAAT
jgi:hypothetical protein